jgi:hypothetical protein
MKRLRAVVTRYLLSVAFLTVFCTIKYLIIPKIEDYEVFSYVLGGGTINVRHSLLIYNDSRFNI